MANRDFRETHTKQVQSYKKQYGDEQAMKLAIGSQFEAFGIIEREILVQHGLHRDGYVIDVGCGSGRLAKPLAQYLDGKYLGIDIVPELLDHARCLTGRPEWRFELVDGLWIPEEDNRADIVCFFSVFTHLLHEESYRYLQEAKRVLKPHGKIVFSFLEFRIPYHWEVFDGNVKNTDESRPLNMFISRDAIAAWASHLGLEIEAIHDGDKPHTPLSHPVTLDDGKIMKEMGHLGQSICVLIKT